MNGSNWERAFFILQTDDCFKITGPKGCAKSDGLKELAGPALLYAADDNADELAWSVLEGASQYGHDEGGEDEEENVITDKVIAYHHLYIAMRCLE
jgi:hypothetical protein